MQKSERATLRACVAITFLAGPNCKVTQRVPWSGLLLDKEKKRIERTNKKSVGLEARVCARAFVWIAEIFTCPAESVCFYYQRLFKPAQNLATIVDQYH